MFVVFCMFFSFPLQKYQHFLIFFSEFYLFSSYCICVISFLFSVFFLFRVTFCGITMKNYSLLNMSESSCLTVKKTVKALSNLTETLIFILLGVSTVNDTQEWNTSFIGLTILLCTVYRTVGNLFFERFFIIHFLLILQYGECIAE